MVNEAVGLVLEGSPPKYMVHIQNLYFIIPWIKI